MSMMLCQSSSFIRSARPSRVVRGIVDEDVDLPHRLLGRFERASGAAGSARSPVATKRARPGPASGIERPRPRAVEDDFAPAP